MSASDRTKPLGLGASYMCRRLGKRCAATLVAGTGHMLRLRQESPSKNYGDGECESETSFAWVVARPSPCLLRYLLTYLLFPELTRYLVEAGKYLPAPGNLPNRSLFGLPARQARPAWIDLLVGMVDRQALPTLAAFATEPPAINFAEWI